jgi:hypothetical protein
MKDTFSPIFSKLVNAKLTEPMLVHKKQKEQKTDKSNAKRNR